jgi:hypothetical protein
MDAAGKKEKPAGFVMEYLWILMSWKHEQKMSFFVEKKALKQTLLIKPQFQIGNGI